MNSFRLLGRRGLSLATKEPRRHVLSILSRQTLDKQLPSQAQVQRCLSFSAKRLTESDKEDKTQQGDGTFRLPKHQLTSIDKFYVVVTGLGSKGSIPDEASQEFMEKVHSRRRILVNVVVMGITVIFAYFTIVIGKRRRKEVIEEHREDAKKN